MGLILDTALAKHFVQASFAPAGIRTLINNPNTGRVSENSGGFLSNGDIVDIVNNQKAIAVQEGEKTNSLQSIELVSEDEEGDWSDWTVDLRLGEEVFLTSDDEVRQLAENDSITINPGEFALLMTEEVVNIPNDIAAFISLKFKHARKGLINISGFHVDPNYSGKLVFSVYNASPSPVVLRRGDPAFMIVFSPLTHPVSGNRDGANFSRITKLDANWIESLQGRTTSLQNLNSEVRDLQHKTDVNRSILVGIGLALVGGFLSLIVAVLTGFLNQFIPV